MYKLVKNEITNQVNSVRIIDGDNITTIPFDEANTDYQAYLKWVAEGNTPLPADE
jgi:hypothetical protein